MKGIVELKAENVKRLRAVTINADGKPVIVVAGRNAQGKTSVLDSIEMALAGKRSIPERPIRDGELRASIVLKTDDYTISRVFTPGGSRLEVTAADGVPVSSPQALLDSLTGRLSFDPLAFMRDEAKQVDTLKHVMGLDFDAVDKERASLYAERTELNRTVKELTAQYNAAQDPGGEASERRVDVAELNAELAEAVKINSAASQAELKVHVSRDYARAKAEAVERAQAELREAEAVLERLMAELAVVPTVNTVELVSGIKNADAVNKRVEQRELRAGLLKKLKDAKEQSDDCTRLIEDIDREKAEAIKNASARFPVPGLGFDESGVTLNSVPFKQSSSAEQLRTSISVGLALNPELKVVLIRDGSLLDADNLRMVEEMAMSAGAQVWIERVSDGNGATVIIEDGAVLDPEAKGE